MPLPIDKFLCLRDTVPGELFIYPSQILFKPQHSAMINAELVVEIDQVQAVTADSAGYVLGRIHLRTSMPGESLRGYEFLFTHRLESCHELLCTVLRARSIGGSIRITELLPVTTLPAPLPQRKSSPHPRCMPPAVGHEVLTQSICAQKEEEDEEELPLENLQSTQMNEEVVEGSEAAKERPIFKPWRTCVVLAPLLMLSLGVAWVSMCWEERRPALVAEWSTWLSAATRAQDFQAGEGARFENTGRARHMESLQPQEAELRLVQQPLPSPPKRSLFPSGPSWFRPAAEASTAITSTGIGDARQHPPAEASNDHIAHSASNGRPTDGVSRALSAAFNWFVTEAESTVSTITSTMRRQRGHNKPTPRPPHPQPDPPPPPPPLSKSPSATWGARFEVWVRPLRWALEAGGERVNGLTHRLLVTVAAGVHFAGNCTAAAMATMASAVSTGPPYLPGAAVAGFLILVLAAASVASERMRRSGFESGIECEMMPLGSTTQEVECGSASEMALLRAALKSAEREIELEKRQSQVALAEHSLEVERLKRSNAKLAHKAAKAVHRAQVLETLVNQEKRPTHALELQTKNSSCRGTSVACSEPRLMSKPQLLEEVKNKSC